MIPFILLPLLATLTTVATVVVKWDEIVIRWKGKRLAILGERAVGKTCFYKFLTECSMPDEHKATNRAEKTNQNRRKIGELELILKEGVDVPGEDAYIVWKAAIEKSDVIIYMFRVDEVFNKSKKVCDRIKGDLAQIKEWQVKKPIFLVGTYLDNVLAPSSTNNEITEFKDKLKKLDIYQTMSVLAGAESKLVVGSAKNNAGCESLALEIFKAAS